MSDFEVERIHTPCTGLHDRFTASAQGTNYTKQYFHMYNYRTHAMKEVLTKLAKEKWSNIKIADRVIDTEGASNNHHEWVIIGVLYKEMKLRQSVLDDFKGSGTGMGTEASDMATNITSSDDILILEDDSGRIAVNGGDILKTEHIVTGVVLALKGRVDSQGVLQVSDYLSYDACYSNSQLSNTKNGEDNYIMLVSGLGMGKPRSPEEMVAANDPGDVELSRQMLLDWLSGRIGDENEVKKSSLVSRLIIAGDSIDVPAIDSNAISLTYGPSRTKLEKEHQLKCSNIIKRFDAYLAMGLASLPIDVMPGKTDPAVQNLPQQPLHPCLLPVSSRFSSLSLVTNPYDCRIGESSTGCRVIGHSGQPVSDIVRQTDFSTLNNDSMATEDKSPSETAAAAAHSSLQALKMTLQWGHIAPTAPDTLPCYPLTDSDPFIMPSVSSKENDKASLTDDNNTPHILFAGNQPCFASELIEKASYRTLLLCIPSFRETGTAVLVNIRTLEASTINFQIDSDDDDDNAVAMEI